MINKDYQQMKINKIREPKIISQTLEIRKHVWQCVTFIFLN